MSGGGAGRPFSGAPAPVERSDEQDDLRRGAPFRPTEESVRGEFRRQRAEAETVFCEVCGQPPGETCTNPYSGKPIEHYPAHLKRTREAQHQAQADADRRVDR